MVASEETSHFSSVLDKTSRAAADVGFIVLARQVSDSADGGNRNT
jgi:hypothetical protein